MIIDIHSFNLHIYNDQEMPNKYIYMYKKTLNIKIKHNIIVYLLYQ